MTRITNHGLLEVDGVEVAKAEIVGRSNVLRTDTPFYVGGLAPAIQDEDFPFEVR